MGQSRAEPPTRLHIDLVTPVGQHFRWGADESNPANSAHGLRFSTSMPGGFDSLDVTLPRKTAVDYADLDRLSTLRLLGAGGEVAGEYRLERAPRASGNEISVSPGAVGWQAHLEDDKSAVAVIIDSNLGNWGEPTTQRRVNGLASGSRFESGSWSVGGQDSGVATPGLVMTFNRIAASAGSVNELIEVMYYGGGATLGKLRYDFDVVVGIASDANWLHQGRLASDDIQTVGDTGTDHNGNDALDQTVSAAGTRKYAFIENGFTGTATADGNWVTRWLPKVLGNHGLAERGTWPDIGFYASDVIPYVLHTWAPLLNFTEGADGTIQPSSFVIPHLEFREPTTAAEIVKQANRFHLRDWAVWEDKTFHYHDRGARGRRWRARIAPAQLSETGPQVDRLWNGVIVKFNDVDGTSKTVGPVGSNANTETAAVEDDDPENPVNQLGIRRWTELDMGGVSTVAGATQVGQIFIEQSKLLDSSGQAQLVGVVEDDRGIQRPAWQCRAGDYISFVDAADTSERRIVKTDYQHDSRTCSIDLDAPPEGMDALLERLGVVLVPLGL